MASRSNGAHKRALDSLEARTRNKMGFCAGACDRVGIEYELPDGMTRRTLRHPSASYLMNLGVPLPVIPAIS